jgi:hypothetical protein
MSLKELPDEDILDFLMTSEFENNYSPEELKYLLKKWKFFYRLFNGKYDRLRDDKDFITNKLELKIDELNKKILALTIECAQNKDEISFLKNKKLSWKERIKGKIINKDEDK